MLDHLRQVIGLRGYGQRDPLNEYKAEAFSLFEAMSQNLREAVTAQLMRVEIMPPPPEQQGAAARDGGAQGRSDDRRRRNGVGDGRRRDAGAPRHRSRSATPAASLAPAAAARRRQPRDPKDPTSWGKVGRNEACPCGSGKKFKHCHGRYV